MNTNIILLLDFAVLGELHRGRPHTRSHQSPHSSLVATKPVQATRHCHSAAPRSARSNDQIEKKVVEHACVAASTTWSVVCANSRAQLHVQRAEGGLARLLRSPLRSATLGITSSAARCFLRLLTRAVDERQPVQKVWPHSSILGHRSGCSEYSSRQSELEHVEN